jgi:hypothetical protein
MFENIAVLLVPARRSRIIVPSPVIDADPMPVAGRSAASSASTRR